MTEFSEKPVEFFEQVVTEFPEPGCVHHFEYAGVRFREGTRNLPGSGARSRYYAHVYFCDRCLETQSQQIGAEGNTYEPIRYGATPAIGSEVTVPEDRYRY